MASYFDNTVYKIFKKKEPSKIKRLSADNQKCRRYGKTNMTS